MAKFPTSEAKITALAESTIAEITANSEIYPTPVIAITEIETILSEFKDAQEELSTAGTRIEEARKKKDDILRKLIAAVKPHWAGHFTPTPLEIPGVAGSLQATRLDPGTIELKWQSPSPSDGGKVASYEVQQLDLTSDIWHTVATSTSTSTILSQREQGQTLKYRVFAFNHAGMAIPSNPVAIVA